MESVAFGGWPNCIRLANSETELIITTDIGPRIISCGMIGKPNLFYVSEQDAGRTGGDEWRIYGGHRLWHAPEVMPRTYFPDNFPVEYSYDGKLLRLSQPVESTTGIIKELDILLDSCSNHVSINHRLINNSQWTIETAAWAITSHAAGSIAILPQEPYIEPELDLLPSRPIVLWNYTRMTDKRFTWGDDYILIQQDTGSSSEQKIGILNKQGWCAVIMGNTLMVKRFACECDATYPDFGSNNEAYVNGNFVETETLGPVTRLKPGAALEHREEWFIHPVGPVSEQLSEQYIKLHIQPLIDSVLRQS